MGDASVSDTSGISFEWNSIPVGSVGRELAEESRPSEAVAQIPEHSWEPCAGDICGRVRNAFTKNTETPGWQPVPPRTRLPRPSLYRFLSDGVSRYSPSHHLSRSSPSPIASLCDSSSSSPSRRLLHRSLTQSLSLVSSRVRVSLYRDFQYRARMWSEGGRPGGDRSLLWRVPFPAFIRSLYDLIADS